MDNNTDVLEGKSGNGSFGGFRSLRPINETNVGANRLKWLWDQISKCDYAFDDFTRGNPDVFLLSFTDTSQEFFEVGDIGLATVQNIMQGSMCDLHFTLWDRSIPFSHVRKAAVELMDYLFLARGVHRVNGKIPSFNQFASRFAMALGMKFEGEIREAILFHGKYYSLNMYGILKQEYLDRRPRLCISEQADHQAAVTPQELRQPPTRGRQ